MRVTICSAFWGRPHISRLWWKAADRVRRVWAEYGIESEIVAGGSELDQAALARSHDAQWINLPNQPLGNKWNGIVQRAALAKPDYIMILGSDDFLSNEVAREYVPFFEAGLPYFGLIGLYFYDIVHKRLGLMKQYPESHPQHGHIIGAGRTFDLRLIHDLWNRPWTNAKYQGLDSNFVRRVNPPPPKKIGVHRGSVALDVKCCTNIWSFDDLTRVFGLMEPAKPNHVSMLPEWPEIQRLEPEESPKLACRSMIGKQLVR